MDIKITSTANKQAESLKKAFAKTTPLTQKAIKKELAQTEQKAKAQWPTRQEKYGPSKNSKSQIKTAITTKQMVVTGSISNSAEYAWAIKAGATSDTSVKKGKRIADELLYKPIKKASDKIAKKVADELMNTIRRG